MVNNSSLGFCSEEVNSDNLSNPELTKSNNPSFLVGLNSFCASPASRLLTNSKLKLFDGDAAAAAAAEAEPEPPF